MSVDEKDYFVALIVRDSSKGQLLEPVVDVSSKFNISEKRSFLLLFFLKL